MVLFSHPKSSDLVFGGLYSGLKTSLLSHSRSLRLQTLRLLTSPLVQAAEGAAEVLSRALQAEEVSIDVQGARERVLRINRLPIVVKDGDELGAEICALWLIGKLNSIKTSLTVTHLKVAQLKVNLRPLWSAAASALSMLAGRFGDLVWDLLFRELQAASAATKDAALAPAWVQEGSEEAGDDVWEDERTWRDPSAHKMRTVLARWLDHTSAEHAIIQVCFYSNRL